MLREPSLVAQWHGWEADDLTDEIKQIYFNTDVVEGPDHTSLTVNGGDVFELHPVSGGTEVKITRAALDHDSEWAEWDEDITQGWLTFLHQLRFALERHPHGQRRTHFISVPGKGGLTIEKLGMGDLPPVGEEYSLTLATGEKISGKVWFKSLRPGGPHRPQLRGARRRTLDRRGAVADSGKEARRRIHGDCLHVRFGGAHLG